MLARSLRATVVLTVIGSTAALAACSKLTEPPKEEAIQSEPAAAQPKQAAPPSSADSPNRAIADARANQDAGVFDNGKLEMKDLVVGKGAEAKTGDKVSVHYVGTLPNGAEFDQSKKRGKPFEFTLGQGDVIKGWDQGVVGMKVGGKRRLAIPPSLGYGARGFPPVIPPNSPLNFDIELLEVKKK